MCGTWRMHGFCVYTSFIHLASVVYTINYLCLMTADGSSDLKLLCFNLKLRVCGQKVSEDSFFPHISVYSTHQSTWGSPTVNQVLNSSCQTLSRNRCVVVVCKRHAEVLQLPHISPKPPRYSGSQWGVRALETLVELVSEEIINSSVMLTFSSETCMSPENFYA